MGHYRRTFWFLIFKLFSSPPPDGDLLSCSLNLFLFPPSPPPSLLLINLSNYFSLFLPNPLYLALANTQRQLQLRMRLAVRDNQLRPRPPLSRHQHTTTPRVLLTDAHGYAIYFHGDAELHPHRR
jgi:hypothetical protein